LSRPEEIATQIAGPEGEVWTVAPAFEQSGVGHCISYTHPMMIAKLDTRRYATEGSPADCVLAASMTCCRARGPTWSCPGVNRGNNAAENVLYSGTIGGAMEAALQGIPAIALSQFMGPRDRGDMDDPFECARRHGGGVVRALLDKGIWAGDDYRLFYNVNFPPARRPIRRPRAREGGGPGLPPRHRFSSTEPHISPSGQAVPLDQGRCRSTARPNPAPMPRSTSPGISRSRRCGPT
jgi:5'-nucleotidase